MSEQSFSEKMKTCRNRALKAWLHYLGYLCAWAAILLLVLASGVILDNTFVLQPGALYEVLHFVRSNVEIVFCVLLLAGWLGRDQLFLYCPPDTGYGTAYGKHRRAGPSR